MTTKFLNEASLGPEIVKLLKGDNIRCAVAFWGDGAFQKLFSAGEFSKARIICDISLGGTNPRELRNLGAPNNTNLKQLQNLHAKVYISHAGAIVCSANASNNGIGFRNSAGLVEAGIHVSTSSDAYRDLVNWYEQIWKRAKLVDAAALEKATETWSKRQRGHVAINAISIPEGVPSLLRTVVEHPEHFRGVGFVFTTGDADEADRDAAADRLQDADDEREVQLLSDEARNALTAWPMGHLFTDWSKEDLSAWPERFVCIHKPGNRVSYWFYKREHLIYLEARGGVVFATRPKGMRAELGFASGNNAMLANDRDLLFRIFEHCEQHGHWLCENGESLARLVADVEAVKSKE